MSGVKWTPTNRAVKRRGCQVNAKNVCVMMLIFILITSGCAHNTPTEDKNNPVNDVKNSDHGETGGKDQSFNRTGENRNCEQYVRQVEKRYLEALVREASAKAYLGWRVLKNLDYAVQKEFLEKTDDIYLKKMEEASDLIHGYYDLVVKIAETTQVDLFAEVKKEISDWQNAHEKRTYERGTGSLHQSKTLDLLERHVRERRKGDRQSVDQLVRTFIQQPELR